MHFYEDPDKPFRFRNGQRVQAVREPNNEHDANAVAITTGRASWFPTRHVGAISRVSENVTPGRHD